MVQPKFFQIFFGNFLEFFFIFGNPDPNDKPLILLLALCGLLEAKQGTEEAGVGKQGYVAGSEDPSLPAAVSTYQVTSYQDANYVDPTVYTNAYNNYQSLGQLLTER